MAAIEHIAAFLSPAVLSCSSAAGHSKRTGALRATAVGRAPALFRQPRTSAPSSPGDSAPVERARPPVAAWLGRSPLPLLCRSLCALLACLPCSATYQDYTDSWRSPRSDYPAPPCRRLRCVAVADPLRCSLNLHCCPVLAAHVARLGRLAGGNGTAAGGLARRGEWRRAQPGALPARAAPFPLLPPAALHATLPAHWPPSGLYRRPCTTTRATVRSTLRGGSRRRRTCSSEQGGVWAA